MKRVDQSFFMPLELQNQSSNCIICNPANVTSHGLFELILQFEKIVKLENNIVWGRSVNAPHEDHEEEAPRPANPIVDAADELEATEAAARREAAIAHARQEEDRQRTADAAAALSALPLTIKVVPFPGFVIKTRRIVMDDNKVFINVFHHTSLPDEFMMLTYTPFIPKTTPASPASVADNGGSPGETAHTAANALNDTVSLPTVGERMTPIVYCGAPSSTEDKEGYVSLLYNVLVSSAYFERSTVQGQDVQITHPTSVNKVNSGYIVLVFLLFVILMCLKCFMFRGTR